MLAGDWNWNSRSKLPAAEMPDMAPQGASQEGGEMQVTMRAWRQVYVGAKIEADNEKEAKKLKSDGKSSIMGRSTLIDA